MTAAEFDDLAASPPLAGARFTCARHGTEAGVVRLLGGYARGWMAAVDSFAGLQRVRIHEPTAEALREAVETAYLREIHALNAEWAPFFCPECGASYCGECWRWWEVVDPDRPSLVLEVRGVCPAGHERMLVH